LGSELLSAFGDELVSIRVEVNRGKCCGYGICAEICPSVYKLDEQGFLYLHDDVVPEGARDRAVEGADACPEAAIRIING
jgi:ferredoxin